MKLIIRNGTVLRDEPAVETHCDIAIENGLISEIGSVATDHNAKIIDASGKLVIPGLVDIHAHFIAGINAGYFMLVSAGVTTALDPLVGSGEKAAEYVKATPVGLNIACLYVLKPGLTVSGTSPGRAELKSVMDDALEQGVFGFKIIGAHCPLSPEASALAIEIAAQKQIPLMFHAGSTVNRDNLKGMREAIDIAGGNPFILAHVNTYCNGLTLGDQKVEAIEALNMLNQHPEIISESTLSELSCIGTKMKNDIPESLCMIDILAQLGFPSTHQGLLQAIECGKLQVSGPDGQIFRFLPPESGVVRCRELNGAVTVGIKKHDMVKNLIVAAGRRRDGNFTVNAISTDGGIVPRNVILEKGLAAVAAGVFTLPEFVEKSSRAGARILALENKGVLAPGFDADITIADPLARRADTVISGGRIIFRNGRFFPAENYFHSQRAGKRQEPLSGFFFPHN